MYNNKERHSQTHMSQPTSDEATMFSPAYLEAIMATPESFAQYLATLSLSQVRTLKDVLSSMEVDTAQKKAFTTLLDLAEAEAGKNEKALQAHALEEKNILLCLELSKQLKELEQIQHSLAHDE